MGVARCQPPTLKGNHLPSRAEAGKVCARSGDSWRNQSDFVIQHPSANGDQRERSASRLSIGVMVPTKNSARLLPRHLEQMRTWLDLVQEVVVVDSFSTDGTLELIRAGLQHPGLRICSHPPGLYQSWNHGIAQLTTKYTYIATTGDLITREGLRKLFDAAEALAADVVLSKPCFFNAHGEPMEDIEWPIDNIIRSLKINQATRLTRLESLVFAITDVGSALTGSCASDLFRTRVLQEYPFPTEFGPAGDGAWGILHAAALDWAVVPERFSRFIRHPSSASAAERQSFKQSKRMDILAKEAVAAAFRGGALPAGATAALPLEELLKILTVCLDAKEAFDRRRRAKLPWILRPGAWYIRSRRNQAYRHLEELKTQTLRAAAEIPSHGE